MSTYSAQIPLGKPDEMLTPEEMQHFLEKAEDIRSQDNSLGLSYPPESGYPRDLIYSAAEQIPFDGLEDKVWDIQYDNLDLDTERVDGGSMKETFYSPEENLIFQHIKPILTTEFDEILGQELTASHNNQVIEENEKLEPVTNYDLFFTFSDGKPMPVRIGEYRELVEYDELAEDNEYPDQADLQQDFVEAGEEIGRLMRSGDLAYAESINDWEQNISKNRAYDPLKDTVVVTDMGELAENQFTEILESGLDSMEDFLFEDPYDAPFASQTQFLNYHGIRDEMEEYFRAVEGENGSELMEVEFPQENYVNLREASRP
jgi:hypothetical protein